MAQLHEALQVASGWDDDHMNRFEIRGREYAAYRDGGGMIGIDATGVRLDALNLRRLEQFIYEYDFGDGWIHDLRIEAMLPVNPRKTYPACVAGKRAAPPEDCGGPAAFMANHGRSTEDLDDWIDELEDHEPHDSSDYDPDRFDRKLFIGRSLHWLSVRMRRLSMKFTIQALIETPEGLPLTVPVQTIERSCDRIEDVGLRLEEAKLILNALQEQLVRQQLAEHLQRHRACPECRRPRTIKGYQPLRFRSARAARFRRR